MSETTTTRTDAEVIAEIAARAAQRAQYVTPSFTDAAAIVRRADEVVDLHTFESLLPSPRRWRGTYAVATAQSFVDLTRSRYDITEGGDDGQAIVFADRARGKFTAVLNADSWRDHVVIYQAVHSRHFAPWFRASGNLMSQTEFAEFLGEHSAAVVQPDAADLIEVARTFSATTKAEFEAGVRLASGDVQFTYLEETTAQAGAKGTVKVPELFVLSVPIFDGRPAFSVAAELRYRISREGLRIGFVLREIGDVIDRAYDDLTGVIVEGLPGLLHIDGECPATVEPLRAR